MEKLVGYILVIGVLLSIALITAGLAWGWVETGTLGAHYTVSGMTLSTFLISNLRQLTTAFTYVLLINLGIAALMLTPFVRVLASVLYFAFAEHNWKYTAFTAFVLAVLTYSLFLR
ncbi:MAG TPA: DUF1634 domain-containing protein [Armatimonadota bacterium]|nr:DUF1634 domain-containing protein [Armatimonadota bacterium]